MYSFYSNIAAKITVACLVLAIFQSKRFYRECFELVFYARHIINTRITVFYENAVTVQLSRFGSHRYKLIDYLACLH